MKYKYTLIFALLLSATSLLAQSKQELALREKFWNSNDVKTTVSEIPEKWKNESAVILYRNEFFGYTNNGKKMYNPSFIHQRVKLNDKAAVTDFSEFEFEKDQKIGSGFINFSKDETTIGIKIVKPDGKEKILDVDKEIISQDDVNKIAIPGLEVGDILDIYIYEDDYLRSFSGSHNYDPVEKVLSTKYPILSRRIAVEVENDYFLNMESYNGAPKIKEEKTDRRATRRYVLEANDIEKSDFPRWYYPLTELPTIKFQVVFALRFSNESRSTVFLGDDDAERKSSVSKQEILDYYGGRFDTFNKRDVKDILNYLEEKGITDKREQLVQALYYVRHKSYNRFIELIMARENNISYYVEPCDKEYFILNQNRFVNYMSGLAKQLDVDYDIIVATPEYNGSIDDLLIRSNVAYGLRFNFPEPLYFFNLSAHVQADYFPKYLEGTKVYALSVKKNRKLENVSFDTLPVTTAEENLNFVESKIEISDDFKKFTVTRDSDFSGHFKTKELSDRLFFGDYMNEEFKHFNTKHFYKCRKKQSKTGKAMQNKMDALMTTFRERHEENLNKSIENELDVTPTEYNYTVKDAARYSNKPLSIVENFVIEDELVKKAGPNFIVEVGRFIGGQVHIKEDERQRDLSVYIENAKTFEYKFAVKIPEGYEVVGLDKLRKNVSNNTGAFTSTASIENGMLHFATKKVYAKRKYEAAEWAQMLPWLDAAYQFSQEKVMFKKL